MFKMHPFRTNRVFETGICSVLSAIRKLEHLNYRRDCDGQLLADSDKAQSNYWVVLKLKSRLCKQLHPTTGHRTSPPLEKSLVSRASNNVGIKRVSAYFHAGMAESAEAGLRIHGQLQLSGVQLLFINQIQLSTRLQ